MMRDGAEDGEEVVEKEVVVRKRAKVATTTASTASTTNATTSNALSHTSAEDQGSDVVLFLCDDDEHAASSSVTKAPVRGSSDSDGYSAAQQLHHIPTMPVRRRHAGEEGTVTITCSRCGRAVPHHLIDSHLEQHSLQLAKDLMAEEEKAAAATGSSSGPSAASSASSSTPKPSSSPASSSSTRQNGGNNRKVHPNITHYFPCTPASNASMYTSERSTTAGSATAAALPRRRSPPAQANGSGGTEQHAPDNHVSSTGGKTKPSYSAVRATAARRTRARQHPSPMIVQAARKATERNSTGSSNGSHEGDGGGSKTAPQNRHNNDSNGNVKNGRNCASGASAPKLKSSNTSGLACGRKKKAGKTQGKGVIVAPSTRFQAAVEATLLRGDISSTFVPVTRRRPSPLAKEQHAGYEGMWPAAFEALQNANVHTRKPSEFILCRFEQVFVQSGYDRRWSCGYRNLQTVTAALMAQPYYGQRLFGGCPYVPALSALQKELEAAWYTGFDRDGAAQFGYRVSGTGKWIGTTEVCALLRYYGLDAQMVTFHKAAQGAAIGSSLTPYADLVDWVWHYFHFRPAFPSQQGRSYPRVEDDVFVSEMPPLYFQHDGHSRTVIGMERKKTPAGVKVNLLVLDPQASPHMVMKALLTGGWEKHLKRGLHTLHKPSYQLVYVRGVMDAAARDRSKAMHAHDPSA